MDGIILLAGFLNYIKKRNNFNQESLSFSTSWL